MDTAPQVTKLVFVEQQPLTGRVVAIAPGMTIGREGCDIVVADPEVSRRHAHICAAGAAPAIEDLGSTNGTFVNGHRARAVTALSVGDVLRFGNTVWHVQALDAVTRIAGP